MLDRKRLTQSVWQHLIATSAAIAVLISSSATRAELPPQSHENASLIVEGVVWEAFQSMRQTTIDYVYLIEVRSARVGPNAETPYDGAVPKPGDVIYVHAFQLTPDAPRIPGPGGYQKLPAERTIITAYLYPRNGAGWQFAYPVGFEKKGSLTNDDFSPNSPQPARGGGTVPRRNAAPRQIGVFVTPTVVGGQRGLRIDRVTAGSPAALAGIELGDVILTAAGVQTQSVNDLTSQVVQAAQQMRLTVRDARSGQVEELDVEFP